MGRGGGKGRALWGRHVWALWVVGSGDGAG